MFCVISFLVYMLLSHRNFSLTAINLCLPICLSRLSLCLSLSLSLPLSPPPPPPLRFDASLSCFFFNHLRSVTVLSISALYQIVYIYLNLKILRCRLPYLWLSFYTNVCSIVLMVSRERQKILCKSRTMAPVG